MSAESNGAGGWYDDAAAIFEQYEERLRRVTGLAINTTSENIEDACSYAFLRLLLYQPEREKTWGWLKVVARNEALRLDRAERDSRRTELTEIVSDRARDRKDPIAAREAIVDARERLGSLRERQQVALLLRGLGWSQAEAAQRMGMSTTRMHQVLTRGMELLNKADREAELDRQDQHPRARLLDELQRNPPPFLRTAIGRRPQGSAKKGGLEQRLEWSRLALAIVDYRVENGIVDPARALGHERDGVVDEGRVLLEDRIDRFNSARQRTRERGKGLGR